MTTSDTYLAALADLKTDLTSKITALEAAITSTVDQPDPAVLAAIADLKGTVDAAPVPAAEADPTATSVG